MPKRPPRSQRRGQPRPTPRPVMPTQAAAPPVASAPPAIVGTMPAQAAVEPVKERSLSRFTARDYTYVRRELVRIAIIATAMLIIIFVLSFFLP